MPIAKFPQNRQWTQPNSSVLFGNIYATKNMDFSLPGFLKLAPRTRYLYRESTASSTFDYVLSIVYGSFGATTASISGEGYHVVTSDGIYLLDDDLDGCAILTNASAPNCALASTDAVAWNGGLCVSESTDVESLSGGTWTDFAWPGLTTGIPHPLCAAWNNLLLVGNGNMVDSRDTGGSITDSVVLIPSEYRIQWMRSFNKNVWIGTRNLNNGQAKVYQWDGSSENFNNEYEVDTPWIYSGESWNGNLYIMTADGRLMSFNGAGFSEVGRLPCFTDTIATNNYLWNSSFTLGSMFQRGMAMIDGLPHIMINAEADKSAVSEEATSRFMSGVWVFDPNIGFYHKYGASNSQSEGDWGQMTTDAGAGAICPVLLDPSASSLPSPANGSTLIFGTRVAGGTGTNYYTLNSACNGLNRGWAASTRIESPEVQDSWKYVWLKYEQFADSDDSIILKYRTKYRSGLPFSTSSTITYTSSTVFTSADANFANVVDGDEVTILSGPGAGCVAHVSDISENAGTYTVTLDEAITGVSATNTARVAVDNFHKLKVISIATEDGVNVTPRYAKITIPLTTDTDYQPAPSEWLEVKVEVRGDGVKITEFQVLSENHTKVIF